MRELVRNAAIFLAVLAPIAPEGSARAQEPARECLSDSQRSGGYSVYRLDDLPVFAGYSVDRLDGQPLSTGVPAELTISPSLSSDHPLVTRLQPTKC